MKLKLDSQGHPLLDPDGHPIYLRDDGTEAAANLPDLLATIDHLSDQTQTLRTSLDAFRGIDPTQARSALSRLDELSSRSMIDADEAEQLRRHVEEQYTHQLRQREEEVAQRDSQIRQLLVKSAFESSDYLRDQTLLVPDMAYVYFGEHFQVEEQQGKLLPIARIDGKPVMSRQRPGTYATPDEALQEIVNRHPARDRMLKAGHPGGPGGSGRHAGTRPESATWSRMSTEEQARFITEHGPDVARQLIDAERG